MVSRLIQDETVRSQSVLYSASEVPCLEMPPAAARGGYRALMATYSQPALNKSNEAELEGLLGNPCNARANTTRCADVG